MAMYALLTAIFWVILTEAIVIITLSARRFVKGEFKDVLRWLIIGLWLMCFGYTFFLIREIREPETFWEAQWATYLLMSVSAVYILKAAMLLQKFSKLYGFSDLDSKKMDKRASVAKKK